MYFWSSELYIRSLVTIKPACSRDHGRDPIEIERDAWRAPSFKPPALQVFPVWVSHMIKEAFEMTSGIAAIWLQLHERFWAKTPRKKVGGQRILRENERWRKQYQILTSPRFHLYWRMIWHFPNYVPGFWNVDINRK